MLRYLIAAREEVSSTQLRDDLLSLLVAGHETTASVLTWGTFELLRPENAEQLRLLQAELDEGTCCISQILTLFYRSW